MLQVGLVMQHGGGRPMVAATLALLAWNLASWLPEVALLRYAQRCSPALAADSKPSADSRGGDIDAGAGAGAGGVPGDGDGRWHRLARPLRQQAQAWALYARQPTAAAAAALALLYLTVLSWGTLMTAYLKELGLPEAELAVYRG